MNQENHGCINGSLHGVNYATPVPIIGLYIAAGSLACMLLMLYDVVVAGILARKRWLPCKCFHLNSITLTLLSVATKIPVDLTTPMPQRYDQLSKLTGTAIICISMGFVAPSLGINGESECFKNTIALTIFVVTVAVNICIQLHTGVIVLFFVEHIVILSLMLLVLLMLWHIALYVNIQKSIENDLYKHHLSTGSSSMLERLKVCSLYAYFSNPQHKISKDPMNVAVSTICLVCAAIIVEASLRSLVLKKVDFCHGDSDYGLSMPYIVITQIATVLVGTTAVVVRVPFFSRMGLDIMFAQFRLGGDNVTNQTLRSEGITLQRVLNFFGYVITRIVLIAQVLLLYPSVLLRLVFDQWKERYIDQRSRDMDDTVEYQFRKAYNEMIKLKNHVAKSKSQSHAVKFLCQKPPSKNLDMEAMRIKSQYCQARHSVKILTEGQYACGCIKISSLSLALLVKIAQACIPNDRLKDLLNVFHDAKEVVQFTDKAIQRRTSENNAKLAYATALWTRGDFTRLPGLDRTDPVETIKGLMRKFSSAGTKYLQREVGVVGDMILRKNCSSIDEIYETIEGLFVDMLHASYAQLPNAVFVSLRDCPVEKFEENVQVVMKMLLRIGSLECQKNWCFPAGISCIGNEEEAPRELTGQLQRIKELVLVPRIPNCGTTEEADTTGSHV